MIGMLGLMDGVKMAMEMVLVLFAKDIMKTPCTQEATSGKLKGEGKEEDRKERNEKDSKKVRK